MAKDKPQYRSEALYVKYLETSKDEDAWACAQELRGLIYYVLNRFIPGARKLHEDLVQDCLITIYRDVIKRKHIRVEEGFTPYLISAIKYTAIWCLRNIYVHETVSDEIDPDFVDRWRESHPGVCIGGMLGRDFAGYFSDTVKDAVCVWRLKDDSYARKAYKFITNYYLADDHSQELPSYRKMVKALGQHKSALVVYASAVVHMQRQIRALKKEYHRG